MNFRQIKLLNDLEAKIAALEERDKREEADWEAIGLLEKWNIELQRSVSDLEVRMHILENPPKRPRGRPPKVKLNG